jgi:acyl-CoA synthetase (AMP-forming)/AMP-acid ligase II
LERSRISATLKGDDDLPLTIGALARARAAECGSDIVLACDHERLSYAEVDARSRHLARALLAQGVTKGAHVGLLFPNDADFMISALAVTRIGAVVLPFSMLSTADELRGLIARSDTAYLLATSRSRSQDYVALLQRAVPELNFKAPPPIRSTVAPWLKKIWIRDLPAGHDKAWSIETLIDSADAVDEAVLEAVEARVSPADRAVILHTSGSTADPKGVVHCHGPLLRHRNNLNLIRGFGRSDVLYSPAPWFWIAGFSYCILGTMLAGARVISSTARDAADILDVLEREQPTIAIGYAQTAAKLAADPSFARRDLSALRYGNLYPIMPPEARLRDPGLRFVGYGLTEGGSAVTSTPHEDALPEHLRGCNGPFCPGYEARIVDPETGDDRPQGELGELYLRGPFMMDGYYGKPRSAGFDRDGWYHTGDLGRIDENGYFFLSGRLSAMIKSSFANVSPREVEQVMAPLLGGRPCLVLGVPDPERGQAVTAVVITDEPLDEDVLRKQLAEKLSSYKVPRRILFVKDVEMPVLSSGKTNMPKLMELVQERW